MENKAITVSQLNNYIKQVFEAEELLHGIEVVGDIDGIRVSGGAVYFTLKDDSASIPCVCYYPQKLKGVENGTNVIVRGTVSYWHKAGKISFVVTSCESFGFGQLFLQFEALKNKLEAEGFFDIGIKKTLPSTVNRIGVVTSKTGAVLHDIKTVVGRRNPSVDIVLFPSAVQGVGADAEIENGINFLANYNVDVIIVARGGGSKEDLSAFNSERIARAVFTSKIPVVSAVGHETDWTLIDFVADLRAATPSAAAELVVPEAVSQRESAVRAYRHLRYTLENKYQTLFAKIQTMWGELKHGINYKLQDSENKVMTLSGFVEANNPLAVLRRGYAKVTKDDIEITSADELQIDDNIDIKLYNGTIGAKVWTKK